MTIFVDICGYGFHWTVNTIDPCQDVLVLAKATIRWKWRGVRKEIGWAFDWNNYAQCLVYRKTTNGRHEVWQMRGPLGKITSAAS